jgi:hypothetical protein
MSNNPIPSHSRVLKNGRNFAKVLRLLGDRFDDLVMKPSLQMDGGEGIFVNIHRGFLIGSFMTTYQPASSMSQADSKRIGKGNADHLCGSQSATGLKIQGADSKFVRRCLDKGHACGAGSLINSCKDKTMMNCQYVASNHYR